MAKIVALRHNATEKREERIQYLIYVDKDLLQQANLVAGDKLDLIVTGQHQFLARKAV